MSRSNEFVEVSHYLPFSFLSSSNCKSSKNLSSRYSYEFSTLIFCSNISNRKHICFTQKLLLISISPPFLPLKWTFSYMFFIYVFYLPILLAFFFKALTVFLSLYSVCWILLMMVQCCTNWHLCNFKFYSFETGFLVPYVSPLTVYL